MKLKLPKPVIIRGKKYYPTGEFAYNILYDENRKTYKEPTPVYVTLKFYKKMLEKRAAKVKQAA